MGNLKRPLLNSVTISGNLADDPTIRHTSNGTPVANFRIIWSRQSGKTNTETNGLNCCVSIAAWYWLAESCFEYLRKGSGVIVEGELQSKSLSDGNGGTQSFIEIKARRVSFMNLQKVDSHWMIEKKESLSVLPNKPHGCQVTSQNEYCDRNAIDKL